MWRGSSSRRSSRALLPASARLSAWCCSHSPSGRTRTAEHVGGRPVSSRHVWVSQRTDCGRFWGVSPSAISTRGCRSHSMPTAPRCSLTRVGRRRSNCRSSQRGSTPNLFIHSLLVIHPQAGREYRLRHSQRRDVRPQRRDASTAKAGREYRPVLPNPKETNSFAANPVALIHRRVI